MFNPFCFFAVLFCLWILSVCAKSPQEEWQDELETEGEIGRMRRQLKDREAKGEFWHTTMTD